MKRNTEIKSALGFDDVLLVPSETNVKPRDVSLKTRLTRDISLNIPLVSAGLPNVTESAMAIAMAQLGGIGIIHDNMPAGKQVEEVRRVKRAGSELVSNPITISPDASTAEAADLMATYKISGIPVVDQASKKVAGIITGRDLRFFEDYAKPVSELMTRQVVTVKPGIDRKEAQRLMHEHRIEKLVVVDEQGKLAGLMTVKDIEKLSRYPNAARDAKGFLRVGAAIGLGKDAFDRAQAMTDAGLDVVVVDVAHAHSRDVLGTISKIRQQRSSEVQIIAGNVVTAQAARSVIDAGADAVKVGIGQTSCAATRKIGVGMPQLAAVLDVVEQCSMQSVPVLVDGAVCGPASLAKALAAGAESVVIGHLFFGTDETPAPHAVAAAFDPYQLDEAQEVVRRGSVAYEIERLCNGLKAAMAYTGSKDIAALGKDSTFVRAQ